MGCAPTKRRSTLPVNKHDRSFGSASAAIQRNVIALKGIEDPLRATGRNAFTMGLSIERCGIEKPDYRHRRLLPARRKRPRGRRAAERG